MYDQFGDCYSSSRRWFPKCRSEAKRSDVPYGHASMLLLGEGSEDAIWLEFERSQDDKREKRKLSLGKSVVVERMKDHWHFVSDFCSDFQFRVLHFRYVLDFCVYEFKLRFRVFDMFLTSNFYV